MLLTALFLIPFIASLVTIMTKKNYRLIETVAIVAAVLESMLVIGFVTHLLNGEYFSLSEYFAFDVLSTYILVLITTVVFFISWYAMGYFRKEVKKEIIGFRRFREFYALFHLSVLAMFVAVSTINPIVLWVALEATSLTSVFLVSFYNKPAGTEAAWKYLIINSLGLLLAFFGTILLSSAVAHSGNGIMTWDTMRSAGLTIDPIVAKVAFVLLFIGYGTKVGLAPMHTWLPDAHSKAPTPMSALMSGIMLTVAMYAILRFKLIVDVALGGHDFTNQLFLFFGILSLAIASLFILVSKNYKRTLAYSSIEHMGLIAIGFGVGNVFGIYAALLHLLYHTLAKPLAFFGVGNIFMRYSTTKIAKVQGLARIAPLTAVLFVVAGVALMGIPPFGMFVSELWLLLATFALHPVIGVLILAFLGISFIGLLRMGASMLSGEPTEGVLKEDHLVLTLIPMIVIAVLLLVLSIWIPSWLSTLFQDIISLFS